MDHIVGQQTGAPHIAGTAVALTSHRYNQDEVASELTKVGGPEFARFAQTSGVDTRSLALPLSRYPELTDSPRRTPPTWRSQRSWESKPCGRRLTRRMSRRRRWTPSSWCPVPVSRCRPSTRGWRHGSDSGRISSASRCSGSAASRVRPGWHASMTTCAASPATWRCCCRLNCVRSHCNATTRRSQRSSVCACSATARPPSSPPEQTGSRSHPRPIAVRRCWPPEAGCSPAPST